MQKERRRNRARHFSSLLFTKVPQQFPNETPSLAGNNISFEISSSFSRCSIRAQPASKWKITDDNKFHEQAEDRFRQEGSGSANVS